jgi:phytoene desaturase
MKQPDQNSEQQVPHKAPKPVPVKAPNGPHAIVIGAGISGLASAGLLAREGYRVTVLEANGEIGGRAGSWERDGFRFDTGPSWYLMPEVFDHFYKLMGSSADEQLDLVTLDPGYRVYFEGESAPLDIQATREGNVALFESVEPGSGKKLEAYLDSAADTYEIAKKRFLYTTFQDFKPLIKVRSLPVFCSSRSPPARPRR